MTKRCRSRSKYGNCGLPSRHPGNHAVPIGDDIWYGYTRRTQVHIGYIKVVNGEWEAA